MYNQCTQK